MKKIRIIFLLSIIIILTACLFGGCAFESDEYLRLHVRANSDSAKDQQIKYEVKDEIVSALSVILKGANGYDQAVEKASRSLDLLERQADGFLKSKGFDYGVKVTLQKEYFPTRVYENYTLPAGEYVALIVALGEGKGQNWWCVAYPPLCFSSGGKQITYKSKLLEILGL